MTNIPFLGDLPGVGRLFRSKGETRQKRNLLIFVTANLVSPGGSPARQNYRNVVPTTLPKSNYYDSVWQRESFYQSERRIVNFHKSISSPLETAGFFIHKHKPSSTLEKILKWLIVNSR